MTAEEIEHVRQSWQTIVLLGDAVPRMFYRRLFKIDASAYALFSQSDMAQQRSKFMETFDVMVGNIAKIEECTPMLEDLGRRHAAYGVEDRHYESVRLAIMSTIESGLGQALTAESRAAWEAAYDRMSEPMRRAAAEG